MHEPNRRELLTGAFTAGAGSLLISRADAQTAEAPRRDRKIKLGVVGNGGRGGWITNLFAQDGGYTIHAVADYHQEVADRCGDAHGVERSRRYSGLSGYKRLLESGIEAVALETPPYFFPEHALAAAKAGLHVYMAKPVAVDVPGCRQIEAAARLATASRRVFLVDYQMPTDAANIEVVKQVRAGAIGRLEVLNSYYLASPFRDPPLEPTIEERLISLIWVNDIAIGGGYHVNACIHAVDAAMWAAGAVPVAAMGVSRAGRVDPHGDSHDIFALTFEFGDGLILQHRGKHITDMAGGGDFCGCTIHGQRGNAWISYAAKATLVSGDGAYKAEVPNLYEMGARRNIAAFYKCVTEGDCANSSVRHALDSCLTTILGREAGRRRARITMQQLIREDRRLEVNLKGLRSG
jgi:predicted dehydrogenase